MKNRSRSYQTVTIGLAFAVSLMSLSITGDLRAQDPDPVECLDVWFTGVCLQLHAMRRL